MYYLYRILLLGTPKYYVGITNDPVHREMAHHSAIGRSIQDLKDGKGMTKTNYNIVIAKHILSIEKNKRRQHASLHISFKIILEALTLEEAKAAETRYLSRRGKHCLNKTGKSYYRGGGPKYSERYNWICNQMSKGLL